MLDNIPPAGDGRTPDLQIILKRRQIVDGARQIFLQSGYAEASMDEIAAKAGVSKGTLYNHFDSKDDMFKSLIHAEAKRLARDLPSPDPEDPNPASALTRIGIAILQILEVPATVATLRLVIGALGRFPNLGEEFLIQSLGPTVERIAEYLDTHVAPGDIQIQNTRSAAEQFARWCLAYAMEGVLMPDQPRQTEADYAAWVEQVLRASSISTGAHEHA
ncbi:TetR/AcrR family transcriptional regulator [Microvirga sp. VF16]|uniref:TetR/AcrR family transcriptional regulator n=1 Tax=Microvirga sp. VF16 TaxID=2807101 RepID=UPI00193CDDD6|nr:TetR/AcrR family transcriptional regulator [Microvirga sp. VF16]QRM33853.1 TetR/AcrR family transcriptional regulator [Microvirga sp. VF16]